MNQPSIQLSALLTTHLPERQLIEILDALLKISSNSIEIVIIDDATSKELSDTLKTEIGKQDNDLVFLFEHSQPSGRGNSLNEALTHSSGKFIWAPERADRFNENLLKVSLNRFTSDPAAVWVMDYDLPLTAEKWLEDALEGDLPDDSCFVWNRHVLEGQSFFFNPFLTHLHGAELAMRIHSNHVWHRCDPFFVIDETQFTAPVGRNVEEFFRTAHRTAASAEEKKWLLKKHLETDIADITTSERGDLLIQSRQMLAQEEPKLALELINGYLKKNRNHYEALQIKITALEKLRRHVEASELKHELKILAKSEPPPVAEEKPPQVLLEEDVAAEEPEAIEEPVEIVYSIVVPTTGVGKYELERCFAALGQAVPAHQTELIVVDNASIDDTFDYLQMLAEKNFLNLHVLTNKSNTGFGASLNLGFEKAKGEYITALHNDVEVSTGFLEKLSAGFELNSSVALVAPMVNETSFNAQQTGIEIEDDYVQTDAVDSCCFMVKKELPVSFDERFGLAYFEMEDLCLKIQAEGGQMIVSTKTEVTHHAGTTLHKMGMKLTPRRKWRNRDLFERKWSADKEYRLPDQGSIADRLERLEPPVDPANPPDEWISAVEEYLTDEVRTRIVRSELSKRDLMVIVSTLLMADSRELLRTLEDRLDDMELPPSLLLLFVDYYFEKNIYSRCRHYLKKAGQDHPAFDLFRLKIMVADKETEPASELLIAMLEKYPASPDLFFLASKVYQQTGDTDEANSFAAMANQLDPVSYPTEETAFEVKF